VKLLGVAVSRVSGREELLILSGNFSKSGGGEIKLACRHEVWKGTVPFSRRDSPFPNTFQNIYSPDATTF